MIQPSHRTSSRQSGFTLIEVLLALVLILVVIIGVQRFMSGVASDQEVLTQRGDVLSQSRMVLSNMGRSIELANFTPVAQGLTDFPVSSAMACSASGCQNVMAIRYRAPSGVMGCSGVLVDSSGSSQWVVVEDTYRLSKNGSTYQLDCQTKGSTQPKVLIKNVYQIDAKAFDDAGGLLSMAGGFVPANTARVHLCLIVEQAQNTPDAISAQTDCMGHALTQQLGYVWYRTDLDVAVKSHVMGL